MSILMVQELRVIFSPLVPVQHLLMVFLIPVTILIYLSRMLLNLVEDLFTTPHIVMPCLVAPSTVSLHMYILFCDVFANLFSIIIVYHVTEEGWNYHGNYDVGGLHWDYQDGIATDVI